MKYEELIYLWPPRPQTAIKPTKKTFEKIAKRKNWMAQLKLNGQHNIIYISPDREISLYNRHHGKHRNYKLPLWLREQILSVVDNDGKWMVIDGELLHNKDRVIKNTLYWWDLLVCNNEYLIGTSYEDRHKMLLNKVEIPDASPPIIKATDNIWLAMNISPDQYKNFWSRTNTSYVEGYVFKNMSAPLRPCITENNNGDWQLRCRKPHSGGCYLF